MSSPAGEKADRKFAFLEKLKCKNAEPSCRHGKNLVGFHRSLEFLSFDKLCRFEYHIR